MLLTFKDLGVLVSCHNEAFILGEYLVEPVRILLILLMIMDVNLRYQLAVHSDLHGA